MNATQNQFSLNRAASINRRGFKKQFPISLSLLFTCIISAGAFGQSPNIVSFQGNGALTWTNSNPNLFYYIEWAPSLSGSNVYWQSSYSALADIQSTNPTVTISVPMFYRVAGSSNRHWFPTPVANTGQKTIYLAGDDGYHQEGIDWPTAMWGPRFTVGNGAATNCVTDNMTGLMWLRNPDAVRRDWTNAIAYCRGLDGGEGRSGYKDWRLPNVKELQSLIDFGRDDLALPPGNPFVGVMSDYYWSGTTRVNYADYAWIVSMYHGRVPNDLKTIPYYVWPVRGGVGL